MKTLFYRRTSKGTWQIRKEGSKNWKAISEKKLQALKQYALENNLSGYIIFLP